MRCCYSNADPAVFGRLDDNTGGPRDALLGRCTVGIHQVCVGFVVVVLVGERVWDSLPRCGAMYGFGRFEGSCVVGTECFSEVLPLDLQNSTTVAQAQTALFKDPVRTAL
jgi:hypothetical protein